MPIEEELARLSPKKDMLLTIGVFDGVHLGHKHLISQLKDYARQQNLLSGVVTFDQHPQDVLSARPGLPVLTNLTEKVRLLKNEGVNAVITLSFTQELAQLSAKQFVSLLKKHLRMKGIVVGPDFALGRGREGSITALRELGEEMDFSVTVIPVVKINGDTISSTAIRKALAIGDMKRVTTLLGRPFSLPGPVISGAGRGRELGFPTANLDVAHNQALPAEGVYATLTHIGNKVYQSITNIGRRPTFGTNERTIETHILDYHGEIYGRELKIDIVERVRGEKRFDSVGELKQQIVEDIKQARVILDSYPVGTKVNTA